MLFYQYKMREHKDSSWLEDMQWYAFEVCDTEGKRLDEVVEYVKNWVAEKMSGVSDAI